jgi:hypothetical protein
MLSKAACRVVNSTYVQYEALILYVLPKLVLKQVIVLFIVGCFFFVYIRRDALYIHSSLSLLHVCFNQRDI